MKSKKLIQMYLIFFFRFWMTGEQRMDKGGRQRPVRRGRAGSEESVQSEGLGYRVEELGVRGWELGVRGLEFEICDLRFGWSQISVP